MSLTAAVQIARELKRLGVENERRGPGEDRADLLGRARELQRLAEAFGVPDVIAAAALRAAEVELKRGEPRAALGDAEGARAALGDLREADLAVRAWTLRAEAHAALADWAAVDRAAAAGIALVERYRTKVSAPYLRDTYLRSRIALYGWGVRAACELGDPERALARAELSKCRGVLDRGAAEGPSTPAEGADLGALRARFERANAAVEAGRARGEAVEGRLAERRLLWDLIAIGERRRRGLRTAATAGGFDLGALRARLHEGQAVLYYYWADRERLLVAAFDRDDLEVELTDVGAATRRALDAFAEEVLAAGDGGVTLLDRVQDFLPVVWPRGERARAVLARARRLVVSPHRQLHALPFHALEVDGDYVVRRWAVRLAPNLTCLLAPARPRRPGVLAVGVREFAVPGERLDPLPLAEAEAAEVAALYAAAGEPAEPVVGAAATEGALRRLSRDGRLARYGCLHLACHGLNVDPDTPMESCIYLQDGRLEGLEIPALRLDAGLVVLSACSSGQRAVRGRDMGELPGDELFGLQAALFAAGADEVLANLCPVFDDAAKAICTGFHRHRLDGAPADVALQGAVCDFLDGAGFVYGERGYWAPFQLTAVSLGDAPGWEPERGEG